MRTSLITCVMGGGGGEGSTPLIRLNFVLFEKEVLKRS